jgi:predicted helicase
LLNNINNTIDFYNSERIRYNNQKIIDPTITFETFIDFNSKKITWDARKLKEGVEKNKNISFEKDDIRVGYYRPFCKQHQYFNSKINWSLFLLPNFFPKKETKNLSMFPTLLL